mmetsp:Transcript_55801/g.155374  ORF Transcript_55801/g.155374 Transcript_55801/m.155374 type:complete len:431 (-) Transcript_55801:408-1700(-)
MVFHEERRPRAGMDVHHLAQRHEGPPREQLPHEIQEVGAAEVELQARAVPEVEVAARLGGRREQVRPEAVRQEDGVGVDLHHPIGPLKVGVLVDLLEGLEENVGVQDVLDLPRRGLEARVDHRRLDANRRARGEPRLRVAVHGPEVALEDAGAPLELVPQQRQLVATVRPHHREAEERRVRVPRGCRRSVRHRSGGSRRGRGRCRGGHGGGAGAGHRGGRGGVGRLPREQDADAQGAEDALLVGGQALASRARPRNSRPAIPGHHRADDGADQQPHEGHRHHGLAALARRGRVRRAAAGLCLLRACAAGAAARAEHRRRHGVVEPAGLVHHVVHLRTRLEAVQGYHELKEVVVLRGGDPVAVALHEPLPGEAQRRQLAQEDEVRLRHRDEVDRRLRNAVETPVEERGEVKAQLAEVVKVEPVPVPNDADG